MRIWFDTEFIEDGKAIDLMSIGLVAEDGRTYYAECEECDLSKASDWVRHNVIPHLAGARKPREVIAREIVEFAGESPEFWAYYASYDWVALCQLYGPMVWLPKGWPMFVMDVKQWAMTLGNPRLPEQGNGEHNVLADAKWTKQAWEFLSEFGSRL
ncbi:3'-5' exoribonuclease domain-containing protein [Tundrisphaera sp. TA3]|uniref:3'-5' exoribonuclease domain-containing protein n=1 Tax=Tundrisphaera sp. TA3 TaxID=3435775 RepID=UPI003EBC2FC6